MVFLGINRVNKKYTFFWGEPRAIGVICSTGQYSTPVQIRVLIMYGGITRGCPTTATNSAGWPVVASQGVKVTVRYFSVIPDFLQATFSHITSISSVKFVILAGLHIRV